MAGIAVFLFLVCCSPVLAASFPEWCVLPPTVHCSQNETCKTFGNITASEIVWHAMRGEEEGKQLLFDFQSWPAEYNLTSSLSVIPGDLVLEGRSKVKISGTNISWWQVGYVYCKHNIRYEDSGGGWRPDPLLSPQENESSAILLEAGVMQTIWLSVRVPYGIPSGQYSGTITLIVTLPHTGTLEQQVKVQLTVWNIDLPSLKHAKFPAIFSFKPSNMEVVYGKATDEMKYRFYDLLTEQRVGGDNLYTNIPTNLSIASYLANKGIQWLSLYDVYGAAGIAEHSFYGKVRGVCLNFTDAQVEKVVSILTPVVNEYESNGLLDDMFVYGFDEAPASCEASIRKMFGAIKGKWPQIRTVAVLNWLPPTELPLDVWVLQYEKYNQTEAATWVAAGKQQWWYHCIEPSGVQFLNTFIERPLIMARLLYWLGSAYHVGGWLYYSVAMWQRYPTTHTPMQRLNETAKTDFDPANYIWLPSTEYFANGDGNFVYPGPSGPIPTIRLHNLRDGFEDAELFRMLAVNKVGPLVQPLVRSSTDYTLDPLLMEKQRLLAASMVLHNKK